MANHDLYSLLETDASASNEDLKRNYRRLARQYHPDANPGDAEAEAKFKEISQAYEILSDPDRRSHYDRFGSDMNGQQGFDAGSAQDLFDMFFQGFGGGGGGARRAGPQPGPDAEVNLSITLHEAAFGVNHEITLTLPVGCATCEGRGAAPGSDVTRCGTCGGAGQVRRVRNSMLGQMVTTGPCDDCSGMGTKITSPCADCRGEGRKTEQKSITVKVPAGIEHGSALRMSNLGPAGMRGAPNGTLYVRILVEEDERFERHGDDLHHEATISFPQAVFGATIPVPTLEEDEALSVPAGSTHGTILRIRDKGVPHMRGRGRGDLYIHLALAVPTELDETAEKLLRDYAAARGDEIQESTQGFFNRRKTGKK